LAFFSVRASYIAVVGGDPRTPLSAALGLAAVLGLAFFGLAFFGLAFFGLANFLSFLMAFTNFLKGDTRCGLKPAQWRCKVFFTNAFRVFQYSVVLPNFPTESVKQSKAQIEKPQSARDAPCHIPMVTQTGFAL
jgi:hypothetical protein